MLSRPNRPPRKLIRRTGQGSRLNFAAEGFRPSGHEFNLWRSAICRSGRFGPGEKSHSFAPPKAKPGPVVCSPVAIFRVMPERLVSSFPTHGRRAFA